MNADDVGVAIAAQGDQINGLNLYSYCGSDPINRVDPTGRAWWHWIIGAAIVIGIGIALVVTAGGALIAIGSVASGMSAATLGMTVLAGVFIASASMFTVFGLMAVGDAIGTWASGGSFSDGFNVVMDYGEVAMWATAGAAIYGGLDGYVTYKSLNLTGTSQAPMNGRPNSKYVQTTPTGNNTAYYNSRGQQYFRTDYSHQHFIKGYGYAQPHAHELNWYQYDRIWRWIESIFPW